MAPIPDRPAKPASRATAATAPRAAIVIKDGVITSPRVIETSAAAHFSPIDPNPSLTGKPARPAIVVKEGAVMMTPIPDRPRARIASRAARTNGELACLATAIYFEARSESTRGQTAVAEVVLARKRAPGRPKTICGVVYEGSHLSTGCQFSFTCDGLSDTVRDKSAWARAKRIAALALKGKLKRVARGATYYHANYVSPYWASSMVKVATIGTHVFYRP
jgi:spore germination cell wall hydrolase CwlJ-like protein